MVAAFQRALLLFATLSTALQQPPQAHAPCRTLRAPRRTLHAPSRTVRSAMPPMWPYVTCDGCAPGGAFGLFFAVAATGLGLPASEDVLLVALGSRLAAMGARARAAHVAAALAGVVAADCCTALLGAKIRENAAALGEEAPGLLRRFYEAVSRQIAYETKRDGARLRRDLEAKLNRAVADVGATLERLFTGAPPPPPPPTPSFFRRAEQLFRRSTCNTRTALAGAGQATAALFGDVLARRRAPPPPALLLGATNRAAFGQRWPLQLLAGADGRLGTSYAAGSLFAAATVTLPLQLVVGLCLAPSRLAVGSFQFAIALAQLCRFGPLWAALGTAIYATARDKARRGS